MRFVKSIFSSSLASSAGTATPAGSDARKMSEKSEKWREHSSVMFRRSR
jgi:hypothetical protein